MPRLTPSRLRQTSTKSAPDPASDAKYDKALAILTAARQAYGAGEHQSAVSKVEECLTLCRTIKDTDKRTQIESHASKMADALLQEGVYVIGFSYPVVPKGRARIRTQMSAAHTPEQIQRAVGAFARVGKQLGVIQ